MDGMGKICGCWKLLLLYLGLRQLKIDPWKFGYGGFLKLWYPKTMGFPSKNDHFGGVLGVQPFKETPIWIWEWPWTIYISRDEEKIGKDTAIRIKTTSGIEKFEGRRKEGRPAGKKEGSNKDKEERKEMEEGQERRRRLTRRTEGGKQVQVLGYLSWCFWVFEQLLMACGWGRFVVTIFSVRGNQRYGTILTHVACTPRQSQQAYNCIQCISNIPTTVI